jgi:hypothetical protein
MACVSRIFVEKETLEVSNRIWALTKRCAHRADNTSPASRECSNIVGLCEWDISGRGLLAPEIVSENEAFRKVT